MDSSSDILTLAQKISDLAEKVSPAGSTVGRASADISSLAQKISGLAQNASKEVLKERQQLRAAAEQLVFALEAPDQTFQRLVNASFQNGLIRIGIDVGLFEILNEAGESGQTIESLATKTGVDETLLFRLMRSLKFTGLVTQVDQRYVATRIAQTCTIPPFRAGLRFMFDFITPVFQKLPSYFAETKYKAPSESYGPLQYAHNTTLQAFEYMKQPQQSAVSKDFNVFMMSRVGDSSNWLDSYPFRDRILAGLDDSPESVTVVDLGGGLGHGLIQLREKVPDIRGRLILQDLPETVKQVQDPKGLFEPIGHDFFNPQPIKGARSYFISRVFHDWPDSRCREILQHVVAAMRPGYSKVILNEFILPDTGANERVIVQDLVMMAFNGGVERTETQWHRLLKSVGLRIEKTWGLGGLVEGVIEAVLDKHDGTNGVVPPRDL